MLVGSAVIITPIWLTTGVEGRRPGPGAAAGAGRGRAVVGSALRLELAAIKRVRPVDLRRASQHRARHRGVHGLRHPFAAAGPAGDTRDRVDRHRRRRARRGPAPPTCPGSRPTEVVLMAVNAGGVGEKRCRMPLAVAALAGQSVFLGYNWVVMKQGLQYADPWPFTALRIRSGSGRLVHRARSSSAARCVRPNPSSPLCSAYSRPRG